MSIDYKEIMEDAERLRKLVSRTCARNERMWMALRAMRENTVGTTIDPEIFEEYQETTVIGFSRKAGEAITSLIGRLASVFDEEEGGELPRRDRIAREMCAMLQMIADKNAEPLGQDVMLSSGIADNVWELLGEAKECFGGNGKEAENGKQQ